ncbi:nuclear RNA-splicing-associated protein-domain-containing protein [Umbelopsis sp. PMI_123]|nr:nuclear RNA-splicing-associated protein-domain-containing protein [Umbelopsis sp. PMI_123]
MPKHEKKKKKKRDHSRHVLDLDELKELAKAHRHKDKTEKKKKDDAPVSKATMVPQTKAEHDKEQNVVRKVVDPLTGRTRLVKGSGEIIEEVVSRDKQKEINRMATLGDGLSYQAAQLSGRYEQ